MRFVANDHKYNPLPITLDRERPGDTYPRSRELRVQAEALTRLSRRLRDRCQDEVRRAGVTPKTSQSRLLDAESRRT